jgi:hypothetical protein
MSSVSSKEIKFNQIINEESTHMTDAQQGRGPYRELSKGMPKCSLPDCPAERGAGGVAVEPDW